MNESLLTILGRAAHFLEKKGVLSPRRVAEEVIADALGLKRLDLYLQFDRPLEEEELTLCRERIRKRGERIPSAYLRGKVEFATLTLKVTPDVLIPRLETEIFFTLLAKEPLEGRLFEPCTGSGALAIALKKHFPHLEVVAGDISPAALRVARENAEAAGVEITFVEGDLLAPFVGECDYLVCNPPYVSCAEYEAVEPEVKYEPKEALIGGEKGGEFYERLEKEMARVRKKAFFEIGATQGEALKKIFQKYPRQIFKDWAGHDRFFFLDIE